MDIRDKLSTTLPALSFQDVEALLNAIEHRLNPEQFSEMMEGDIAVNDDERTRLNSIMDNLHTTYDAWISSPEMTAQMKSDIREGLRRRGLVDAPEPDIE